uniref:Synaptopodin n=1 Tax=Sus scrofa TaxID=9823 RepID=A0A286ZLL9_PIG
MLGPHLPSPPLGPSEGTSTPCAFAIPDGSYRCLALETEESGGEEGLQGEAGLTDLEEDGVASRSGDNAGRATQGAPQLPRALGIQPPSCSREARGGSQHDDRASQDWDTAKARQGRTASLSPSPGPRAAWKPELGRSPSLTEKDLKEAKARSRQIAAQLTTPPSSSSRGVQLFNRRRERVNEFTLESHGRRGREPSGVPPASPAGHAPGLGLTPRLPPEPGPPRRPACQSADVIRGPGHSMEGCSEEAGLLRHLEKMASEEEEVPLVVYLKENAALLTANGLHLSQNREAQQTPPTPPPAEADSPEADVNQNPPSPSTTLITPASNGHHNLPVTDVNENLAAPVTPQSLPLSSIQQNSAEAPLPPSGTVPDFQPSTPGASGPPQEAAAEVRSSTLRIDKVSAPPTTTSTFSREVTSISGSGPPAPDFKSSSLLIDVQHGAPVVSPEPETSARAAATMPTKLYSEVHLTLAKPQSVVNRTARPFGVQAPGSTSQVERSPLVGRRHPAGKTPAPQAPSTADRSPRPQRHLVSHSPVLERRPLVAQRSPALERRPLGNFAPPPTYAETLSAAPPASRVRSPPSYSALYPGADPQPSHLKGQAGPASKTGILEESMARRGSRKSMFTFVEKPKVTPNPDLLDLVQTADEKRRQRDQGEAAAEEEPFALGAEASNFQQEPAPRDRASPAAHEELLPEWASCLKSPRIQAKPKPKPNQNLSEASGKGAELYARRQSRMEKYVIESAGHPDLARCPSPTMSLPSSWKYSASAPGAFRVASRSPARTPPASLYHGFLPENGVLRPEPTKQPPYQLRPSLFVLSPIKEPPKAVPRAAAAPAKPSSLDLGPALPKAAFPPSPALPRPPRSSPGLHASPGQDGLQPAAVSPPYGSDVSPVSPSRAWSPRAKQAPRPSFSTRNAGIEAQDRRESLPTSPPWTPAASRPPSSLDGWVSPGPWEPGRGSRMSSPPPPPLPPPPMSPSWSERSVSPLRPEPEARPPSRQLQALLARNIINAARRKSASPRPAGAERLRPLPPGAPPPPPPPPRMRSPLPARPSPAAATFAPIPRSPLPAPRRPLPYRRSPTDSDVSLDSEDSGAKSPGILGYNICPRGWNGSLRLKRGSLPSEASCST